MDHRHRENLFCNFICNNNNTIKERRAQLSLQMKSLSKLVGAARICHLGASFGRSGLECEINSQILLGKEGGVGSCFFGIIITHHGFIGIINSLAFDSNDHSLYHTN